MRISSVLTIVISLALAACQSASDHAADVRAGQDGDKLTLGTVQKQIHQGMSNTDVVSVLGAPNMVTTDDKHRETWVYDKVATDTVSSSNSGGVGLLILGFNSGAGARSTSQRTLTIIIKLDEAGMVRDFSYRSSSF